MPIYSYKCDNCGTKFERTQKFTDPPVTVCPNCHKKRVRKLLSTPSIVFKGSGWYSTDHRSPSGGGNSSHKKESDSKPADKAAEKPVAKAEAKAETKASASED